MKEVASRKAYLEDIRFAHELKSVAVTEIQAETRKEIATGFQLMHSGILLAVSARLSPPPRRPQSSTATMS